MKLLITVKLADTQEVAPRRGAWIETLVRIAVKSII